MTPFIKMHALGNDFVLIHRAELGNADMIAVLSNRHIGIGFDQAIIIDSFTTDSDFFTITFLNADGSHAGGCGNGTRAAAGYFHRQTGKTDFNIHITLPSGGFDIVHAQILGNNFIKIKMPSPRFEASQIPISDLTLNPQALQINNLTGFCVNIGNPHYVMIIQDEAEFIDLVDSFLERNGRDIEHHELFPERINVEIIWIESRNRIRMKVWERGTGITNACGTGACASVIAAVTQGLVDNKTTVSMDGGALDIEYNPASNDLYMTGDYHFVFKGELL